MNYLFVNLGKHYGGAENYLISVINGCLDNSDKPFVIAKSGSPFEKKIFSILPDSHICSVNYSRKDLQIAKTFISKNHIQMINVNGINSGAFINLLRLDIPRITVVHSNAEIDRADKTWLVRKLFVCLENYNLKMSDSIIVVSESIKELLIKRGIGENKINVIHNGVKEIKYSEIIKQRNGRTKLCYIGRLEKVKGCEYLLKALGIIANENFICDIFGDGSLKSELELLSVDLGINKKVRFRGFNPNIREKLNEYDVIVLPSLSEAFPLTIPEAMNARVLLICSNVGGIPYIIQDSISGYLFEAKNYIQLAEKLEYTIQHYDERQLIVERAYELFLRNYTLDRMISKTFKLMENLV